MLGAGRRARCTRVLHLGTVGVLVGLVGLIGCWRQTEFQTVVLVTIDTLRADHVGSYGYPRPTTPFIDSLAEQGIVFENALASSSHTAPSHASLFTSLYPEAHGVLQNGARLTPGLFTTLADALSLREFKSGAFTSVGFLREITQGFDHVDAWAIPKGSKEFRPAEGTVSGAIEWLRGRSSDERLFLWVHLYDVHAHGRREGPHSAFVPRMTEHGVERLGEYEAYLERTYGRTNVGRRVHTHLLHYDAQLAYVDSQVARLHREVEAARSGASLWVITSDHGEGLGNHRYMGHGRNLYNEQLRVPLIVHASSSPWEPSRVGQLVRLVDLYPTLREIVGAGPSAAAIDGVSLVPLLESPETPMEIDALFAQRRPAKGRRWYGELVLAGQTERHKFIYHSERSDEYYDLETDPEERVNLVEENRPEAERLKRWLQAEYARMQEERPETTDDIAPEHLEELRSLGYIN